ncbi:aminotransferase-like domain-containing protein [Nannocystis bainbridge]|uniref:PLP-dependent aminotransferase family protein n=1 Tax=Nannocystis bainbridge TaxID=2995303 RepID=A0ABT5DTP2_9BACT|nr:PLP-dependent aminotransferase family protein [Nannocystis bainbridge]MDC0715772.1 PLP-dependent aminotransferase family protein [Nannocystis bainbridge]
MTVRFPFQQWITPRQPPEVERLLKSAAAQDHVVSLAGGLPADDLFPRAALAEALESVMREHGREALQYQWSEGYGPLREQVVALLRGRGVEVGQDELLITSGAQQALDLLARLLLRPGDLLGIESPTYVAAIEVFGLQRPRMVPLARGEHGLDLEAVRALVRGENQSLLYLAPAGHNPSGSSLSAGACEELVELSRAHDAFIIEDDAYGRIQFDGPRPPLRSFPGAEERVILVGTFSKMLTPGLRVGWLVAPAAVTAQLMLLKGIADLQTNTLGQMALASYLDRHDLDAHVDRCLPRYRERRDALLQSLAAHMPAGVQWTRPTCGFSVWVTLPAELAADSLLARAVDDGVAFEPGAAFFPVEAPRNHLRLSFSNQTPERIAEAVARLGASLRAS